MAAAAEPRPVLPGVAIESAPRYDVHLQDVMIVCVASHFKQY